MKTGEMYTYALANPKAEFIRPDLNNAIYKFSEKGVLLVRAAGTFVVSDLPPKPNEDWELVPQEVTWQEAISAWLDGEEVVCKHKGGEAIFVSGGINMALYADKEKFKYGKWYIKPMTCPLIKG